MSIEDLLKKTKEAKRASWPPLKPIARFLHDQLNTITPSVNTFVRNASPMCYYPCAVTTHEGTDWPCCYVLPIEPFKTYWGMYPASNINVENITVIRESPHRLPARFATQLYDIGESGMGYQLFNVTFRDQTVRHYQSGNAIDFIQYPDGYDPDDVVAVNEQPIRSDAKRFDPPEFIWCIYDGIAD